MCVVWQRNFLSWHTAKYLLMRKTENKQWNCENSSNSISTHSPSLDENLPFSRYERMGGMKSINKLYYIMYIDVYVQYSVESTKYQTNQYWLNGILWKMFKLYQKMCTAERQIPTQQVLASIFFPSFVVFILPYQTFCYTQKHPLHLWSHKGIIIIVFFCCLFYFSAQKNSVAMLEYYYRFAFWHFWSHNMITALNKIKLPPSIESLSRANNIWTKWITATYEA